MSSRNNRNEAGLIPSGLRTEYLVEPLGLDAPNPRLSWVLNVTAPNRRGFRQTAWQVEVATGSEALISGKPDLWDSGEVISGEMTLVDYAGRALASRQQCFWRVRVRDEQGQWSAWSESASWSMGPMRAGDWVARWIGTGETFTADAKNTQPDQVPLSGHAPNDPWFRRAIELPVTPSRATAFVASVGFHELFVNGRKVGDAVLMPGVTDNSKRARYVAYEIGPLLHTGKNVLALWLGTGWSIYPAFATADKPRAPIVLGQFDFDFPDGGQRRVITDASWKWHPSPNRLLGAWYFMNFGGEEYDARQESAEWASAGCDDTAWKAAVVFSPELMVSAEPAEPNRKLAELRPVQIEDLGEGGFRADMGRNFSGWLEIALTGSPGDCIDILVSEKVDEPVTHRMHSTYIMGPSGVGVFRHRFNYCAGRWVTIRGASRKPRADDVRAWLVRTDYVLASSFSSSQPLLNDVHATTLWTLENLSLGGYVVDCPHRERMGYGGDGHASLTTALMNYGFGAFCTKWAEDWRDVQGRASSWGHGIPADEPGGGGQVKGSLPYTAPTHWGGGGPAWSGFCVHLPWESYLYYGDKTILRCGLGTITEWLAFLESKASRDLLQPWGGDWDFLGDWLWPKATGSTLKTDETLFFNNCYWIYNLQTAAAIAGVLDENELQSKWRRRSEEVRAAVHRRFYNATDHSYVNGFQSYLAIALLTGVPPEPLRAAVWRRLEHEINEIRGGHIHAGITGGAMLFKTLMSAQRDDLLYAMAGKKDYPGWGHMLSRGATTWWEAWEDQPTPSLLHSSFLYVGAWFIHGVLGIQPDAALPGFRHFLVRPGVVDAPELSWARGHYDSIRGRIDVAWRRTADAFELEVGIPPNTSATVFIPTSDPHSLREAGAPLGDVPHVTRHGGERGREMIRVGSGHYRFTATLTAPWSQTG